MWARRKAGIALPFILVLALARCGGEAPEQSAGGASQSDYTAEEIRAALRVLEQGGVESRKEYGAEEIKDAMRKHIAQRTRLGNPGVFEISDPQTSQTLELEFQKIHDPVRTLGNGFYFACTNFGTIGEPNKTYDLDFWLQVQDGELKVYQENVHKVPERKDGEWAQNPHYNFVNDRINLLP